MREAISRGELFAFARLLGAEPTETNRIEVTPTIVRVTTYRLDEGGGRFVEDGQAAVDVAEIKVVANSGAATVRMRHPKLAQEVDVPESALMHHARAGWTVVDPDPPYDAGGSLIPAGDTAVPAGAGPDAEPPVTAGDEPQTPSQRRGRGARSARSQ